MKVKWSGSGSGVAAFSSDEAQGPQEAPLYAQGPATHPKTNEFTCRRARVGHEITDIFLNVISFFKSNQVL